MELSRPELGSPLLVAPCKTALPRAEPSTARERGEMVDMKEDR